MITMAAVDRHWRNWGGWTLMCVALGLGLAGYVPAAWIVISVGLAVNLLYGVAVIRKVRRYRRERRERRDAAWARLEAWRRGESV